MKRFRKPPALAAPCPFSILERIDVGETTTTPQWPSTRLSPFSILERIDVGETPTMVFNPRSQQCAFSILERIDVGETSVAAGISR